MMQSRGFNLAKSTIETNFSEQLWYAIKYIDMLSLKHANTEIMITCGSEEKARHTAANTKHYAKNNASGLGEAVDLRTWHYTEAKRKAIEKEFLSNRENRLNFDLIYETKHNKQGALVSEHWHLEYDPK